LAPFWETAGGNAGGFIWSQLTPIADSLLGKLASVDTIPRGKFAMYTRRDVCGLTGIDETRFKTLARRDQLPTLLAERGPDESHRDEGRVRGWNRFTSFEVIQIAVAERLMCQIGYADGVRPETAAKIASQCGNGIARMLGKPNGPDIWVGYVGSPVEHGGADGGQDVADTILQIAKKIADLRPSAERVFLVNVGEVIRTIEQRAERFNILFPNDESVPGE